jgi:hypothetical protein
MAFQLKSGLTVLACAALSWTSPCFAQTPQPASAPASEPPAMERQTSGVTNPASPSSVPASSVPPSSAPQSASPGLDQPLDQKSPGIISGTIVDQSGALVAGAEVRLTGDLTSQNQQALSGSDGQFSFSNIAPGPFRLIVTSAGFAPQSFSGTLHPGENDRVPEIVMMIAANITEVRVGLPQVEVAEEQMRVEEHQRVLGAIPNFYVSYVPDAAPLTSRQKFKLAWKTVIDPITFLMVGGTAGIQQAQDHFKGYGQGAVGYADRFGAGYGDTVSSTFIGGAILPSLLKQDPRYFYKGTGTFGSRFLYAVAMSVVCKGDNKRWQPNYSGILGSMAAGGISNLYYPAQDRDGLGLTIDNTLIGIGESAVANLLQEFLIRHLTPKTRHDPNTP